MIAVVNYGMGNVRSVTKALEHVGGEVALTNDHAEIAAASHIVLPGVGSFSAAAAKVRGLGLVAVLNRQVLEKKVPFMGICLGMQLLAREGFEGGQTAGLGWFEATVEQLRPQSALFKLPHFGWNDVSIHAGEHALFAGFGKQPVFYFAHSFCMRCSDESSVAATANYGGTFAAAILYENIFATQFHPEKSQRDGLRLLENFVNWNPGGAES